MPKQGRLYLPSFLFNGTLLVLLLLVEIACGTTGNMSPLPATSTLINRAQHAIQHVKSHHFQLTTEHPGSGASNSILVTKANGDIVLKAPASAPPSSPAYNTLYFRYITEAAHTPSIAVFFWLLASSALWPACQRSCWRENAHA